MALDFADSIAGGDIIFENTDKYRAYNLLNRASMFQDNPRIGLDIASMIKSGVSDFSLEAIVTQYLIDFGCKMHLIHVASDRGNIALEFESQSSHYTHIEGA